MWKAERFQRIRTAIHTFGKITIENTAKELEVSMETVRRDFKEMEALGELKRIRGGAILRDTGFEPPISQRITEQVAEKRQMAKTACSLINSGQVIFVDAGSTTTLLADELSHVSGVTVITNSVDVAIRMNQQKSRITNENQTILLGGALNESLLATFGDKTVGDIYSYHADVALLSPVGIDPTYGATSYDLAEAEIAKAMVANSRRTVLLADYTKMGVISRVSYCKPEQIDSLITDRKSLKQKEFTEIRSTVPKVFVDSERVQ